MRGGFSTGSSAPERFLEMWIRRNTSRSGSNFLQVLRSQSLPAVTSRQVLSGCSTERTDCGFQLSSMYFSSLLLNT